ncbi:MAG: Yip1 family protein [Bacillota bacterium]
MDDKIFEWLYGVIVSPAGTLNDIAREKPVWWGLLIYLGISVLGSLAALFDPEVVATYEEITHQFAFSIPIIPLAIGGILFSILLLLFYVGALHLFGRLFGGSGGYWNLFSTYTFASFPGIIGVPVTALGGVLGGIGSALNSMVALGISIWVIVLQVIALRESHNLSTGMTILAYFITFFLLGVVPVLLVIGLVIAYIFI